jgi:catechol-2,3-dioxygenase
MTAIGHLGLAVTDLEAAVTWYRDVLGFDPLGGPIEVRSGDGHAGTVAADVFGPGFGAFRQAHLAGANGAALELFEFLEAPTQRREPPFAYRETGLFHFCVVTPDIERLAQRIAASGGRMRTSRVWEIFPGEPYRTCYCQDPFGNVLELYSHSHERTYANRDRTG